MHGLVTFIICLFLHAGPAIILVALRTDAVDISVPAHEWSRLIMFDCESLVTWLMKVGSSHIP